MIVLRFRVQCQPGRADEVKAAFADVVAPARASEGVISFDIAQDVIDENVFVATEVFADEAARARQESLPQVAAVMSVLKTAVAAPPEATVYTAVEPAFA